MSLLFFSVIGLGVAFFVTFFIGCHFDARKKAPGRFVTKLSPCDDTVDSPVGRRYFIHLETQMAEFVSTQGKTA